MEYVPQPTDEEMQTARLIYCRLDIPEEFPVSSPEWQRILTVRREFAQWFEDALREAVAAYGIDPHQVDVIEVDRPPRASPLIPDFFYNLDWVSQALILNVAANIAWDGFKSGINHIRDRMREKLTERGMPESAYRMRFSGAQLEDMCVQYVRRWHPRAVLNSSRQLYNTTIQAGYAFAIDPALPMGWEITVKSSRHTYIFVVDDQGQVLSLEGTEGKRRLELPKPDHLDD